MVHIWALLFNSFSIISIILTLIIITIYFLNQKNDLLVFTGIVILLIQGTILTSSIFYPKNLNEDEYYSGSYLCTIQAIILNYAVITLHGLIACLMYETWSQIIFWQSFTIPKRGTRNSFISTNAGIQSYLLSLQPQLHLDLPHCADYDDFSPLHQYAPVFEPVDEIKENRKSSILSCTLGKSRYHNIRSINGYLLIAFLIPIFPTIILCFFILGWGGHVCSIVQPYAFFCYLSGSFGVKFFTFIGWCLAFSLPGLAFSIHLVYRMLVIREQNLRLGKRTYLTKLSVTKLAFCTFFYVLGVCFHILPHIFFHTNDPELPSNTTTLPPLLLRDIDPHINTQLCWWLTPIFSWDPQEVSSFRELLNNGDFTFFDDPRLAYCAYMRCPTLVSIFPAFLGILFFLMFGFGKHSKAFYLEIGSSILFHFYKLKSVLF